MSEMSPYASSPGGPTTSAAAPPTQWRCDVCQQAVFPTFEEALEHENGCTRSQLHSILIELNGGEPLGLKIAAAIAAPSLDMSSWDDPHAEKLDEITKKLFQDHVGKSPEIVSIMELGMLR